MSKFRLSPQLPSNSTKEEWARDFLLSLDNEKRAEFLKEIEELVKEESNE